eukprot:UN13818
MSTAKVVMNKTKILFLNFITNQKNKNTKHNIQECDNSGIKLMYLKSFQIITKNINSKIIILVVFSPKKNKCIKNVIT